MMLRNPVSQKTRNERREVKNKIHGLRQVSFASVLPVDPRQEITSSNCINEEFNPLPAPLLDSWQMCVCHPIYLDVN